MGSYMFPPTYFATFSDCISAEMCRFARRPVQIREAAAAVLSVAVQDPDHNGYNLSVTLFADNFTFALPGAAGPCPVVPLAPRAPGPRARCPGPQCPPNTNTRDALAN